MGNVNFIQDIPNSHSFGSLQNIILTFEYKSEEKNKNREYFLTGFKNCLKRKYEINLIDKKKILQTPFFVSVQDIIDYLESDKFNLFDFHAYISNTLNNGYDLEPLFKLERREVYEKIDKERDYQDLKFNNVPDEKKSIAEWLINIEYHLNKAKEKIYSFENNAALVEIRKLSTLGICCLEFHGCPDRILLND